MTVASLWIQLEMPLRQDTPHYNMIGCRVTERIWSTSCLVKPCVSPSCLSAQEWGKKRVVQTDRTERRWTESKLSNWMVLTVSKNISTPIDHFYCKSLPPDTGILPGFCHHSWQQGQRSEYSERHFSAGAKHTMFPVTCQWVACSRIEHRFTMSAG